MDCDNAEACLKYTAFTNGGAFIESSGHYAKSIYFPIASVGYHGVWPRADASPDAAPNTHPDAYQYRAPPGGYRCTSRLNEPPVWVRRVDNRQNRKWQQAR
jgi:hypothetical protein